MADYISPKQETLIRTYCVQSDCVSPVRMAYDIMKHPEIRMHGPEHHYLTAAVLAAAYCNDKGLQTEKDEMLQKLFFRTKQIQPGLCGFYGVCGDVLAVGAVVSLILKATPLSQEKLKTVTKITDACQRKMALHEGPRCCKRATFINVCTAAQSMNDLLSLSLTIEQPVCGFFTRNETCNRMNCPFYKKSGIPGKPFEQEKEDRK